MNEQSTELTIPASKANLYGFLAVIVLAPLLLAPFYQIWGLSFAQISQNLHSHGLYFFLILVIGTVVHELIHGATAAWYAGIGWENIRFGIQWQSLTPYCHSKIPMTAKKYRYVVFMPLIILGIFPYFISLGTGSGWLLTIGITFTLAAAGDVMILWLMRKISANEMVQDHPTKIGLLVNE